MNATEIVARMNALRVIMKETYSQIDAVVAKLEKDGLTRSSAYMNPKVVNLTQESTRLYREMTTLGTGLIRMNLERFGLIDPAVVAEATITVDYRVVRTVRVGSNNLSNFCVSASLWPKVELDKSAREVIGFQLLIYLDGETIGHVDSDGRFNYTTAANLRDCVGWAVATDIGREKVLDYNLDAEVAKLERAITAAPPVDGTSDVALKEFFFDGAWKSAITDVMAYKKGSRFSDGYCGVTSMFWRVATRTIRGIEHPAFPFGY